MIAPFPMVVIIVIAMGILWYLFKRALDDAFEDGWDMAIALQSEEDREFPYSERVDELFIEDTTT